MIWFGLTGGIACGKSTVSELLRKSRIPVVDADQIAKQVVLPKTKGLEMLVSDFGPDIVDTDGFLDRKKLGDKVFGNAQATKKLESILHPIIRAEASRQKQELIFQGCKYAVYDVPLLFETKSEDSFDAVIVVTTSRDLQIQRMKERGLNLQEIEKRLSSQLDLQFKVGRADYVIENLGTYRDLELQVEKLITWIKDFKISV